MHTRKSIQPQHKRRSLNLKNGVLELFFLTQGITGEPIYGVGFIENDPLGGCETYQLSISNQNNIHASYDPDVKNTILTIVEEFFFNNLDGLLYLCDTSDSREAARNRLFLRWFEKYSEPGRFTIKTANAIIEEQGIYAAIIVENRNPLAIAVINDFEVTAQMLTEGK